MSRPLSILHAVCTDEFAGVEQFVLRLALAQRAAGHEVAVAGGDPRRMRPALAAAGIPHAAVSRVAATARAIRARTEVDVVNTHMTAADAAGVLALAGRRRRPALVSTRHFAKPRGRLARLDPVIVPWIDAEIAISEYVARSIEVAATVVHSGIPDRPDSDDARRERVVLMAQRLQPEKESLLGVRAFAASGLAGEGWMLLVAGDGPDRQPAERLATELGIASAVTFLGFRDDVPELMQRASLLLATCRIEGFGLSILEAMASGLPVVAPFAGGPVEMLADLPGPALFSPGDAHDAARSLRTLADDAGARAAYGAAARARQRTEYSVAAQAAGTEAVYRAALATMRGAGQ